MCINVFLGSDIEVSATKGPWETKFHVRLVEGEDPAIRKHFSKAHFYLLASHEGCGCGFEWDAVKDWEELQLFSAEWAGMSEELRETLKWTPADELREYEARKNAAMDLAGFLKGLLQKTKQVEVGVFQDSLRDLKSRKLVTPDQLAQGHPEVFPVDGVLYIVSGAQPGAADDVAAKRPRG